MDLQITPPATRKERMAWLQTLMELWQKGMEVGAFAQFFWTYTVGLGYNDGALKDFFNLSLDDPLSIWEMKGLENLDFWDFMRYLVQRGQGVINQVNKNPFAGNLPPVLALLLQLRIGGREGRGQLSQLRWSWRTRLRWSQVRWSWRTRLRWSHVRSSWRTWLRWSQVWWSWRIRLW